jgi:tRNA-Thr(GGU) m(6)t(6)A37 methyltransferase TsaA
MEHTAFIKRKACRKEIGLHHLFVPEDDEVAPLTIRPIGYVRTGKAVKFAALHQPDESVAEQNVLELLPNEELRRGLQDLQGFTRIWLIWWFHRNDTWRSLVLPPRGPARRRGVFATRSPHRPNAIGMTPVKLLGIDGDRLLLGPCDLVDGTPVFDIKPYIPEYDAFPDESSGWLEEVASWASLEPSYRIVWSELAKVQMHWLRDECSVDFVDRVEEILSRDPSPHRTRRIRQKQNDEREMGCGAWRVRFRVDGNEVLIDRIRPGFPRESLIEYDATEVPDRNAQLAFLQLWSA